MTRLLVFAAMLFCVSTALAGFVAVGDPFSAGSWAQGFNETNVGPFDLVAVQMATGGLGFESPAHRDFDVGPSWSTTYETGVPAFMQSTAQGPAVSSLTWNIYFNGDQGTPLAFDFVAFNGNQLLESAHADWNGSGWSIGGGTWYPLRGDLLPSAIPAPAAVVLGALGLGLVGWAKRRLA